MRSTGVALAPRLADVTRSAEDSASPAPFPRVAQALVTEFGDHLPGDVIERCLADESARLRDARVTAFLPILVHRAARDRLSTLRDGTR
ncbi:hypothetical protein BH18ACT4_BH18ACT4_05290 [soil metagenome]